MLTYACMTMTMAIFSLVSWLNNPYKDNKSEIKVNKLKKRTYIYVGNCNCYSIDFLLYFEGL